MILDFSAILVILVAVSGAIWGFDAVLLAPRRGAAAAALGPDADPLAIEQAQRPSLPVDYARSFFPIFVIVLVLRSFLVEPFRIPSGSMMPTLLVGDFILVNKYNYGIRLPAINRKIIDIGSPARGDVVVFRYPEDPSTPYIKRVIGVPGDHIEYRDKTVYVNGERVAQQDAGVYIGVGAGAGHTGASLRREELPGAPHDILVVPDRPSFDVEITVPPAHYFVLGDNRDNSRDSRYWGFVPDENLIGHAFLIWMNWDSKNGGVDWHRIGRSVE
ncbi:MAG: signal peptidase I [Gammaproteobacteria bacterium]|nr:signal peptidase I [Gammaproteobacteria bacterium]